MFFSFFLFFTSSVVVGVDFGHTNIKTGISKANGVYAANNEESKKLSPSYFSIWNYTNPKTTRPKNGRHWYAYELEDLTWDFTSRASQHAKRFPENAIKGFFPLLNESCGLLHREAAALTLRYLLSTIEGGVYTPENTVLSLSVEPFLSRHERFALKEVAKLANTSLAYIIESPIAVADYYVIGKAKRFSNTIVAFVDIGATCTWISIFSFSSLGKSEIVMNQKSMTFNGTLGGNLIDRIVGDFLYGKFVEKTGQTTDSTKIRNRFYEAARVAKERLSIDVKYPVHMEEILGDYGLDYELTREEFNELIRPFTDSLSELLNESMTSAKINHVDIVEVIGGNSRPQVVHEIISNITKVKKISHTLNPEEAVILGTTLLGSTKSSQFKLPKKIKATTFCNVHVELEVEGKRSTVYTKRDRREKPKTKCFTVLEVLNEKIKLFTDEDYEKPFDVFSIQVPDEAKDEDEVHIKFAFDEYTLPYVVRAECNGEKLNITHFTPKWRLDAELFNKSFDFVNTMDEIQRDRKNASATRNQLEQLVWTMQKRIYENEDDYVSFMRDNETGPIKRELEENKKWLEENAKPFMQSKVFLKRLNHFLNLTKDVDMRVSDYNKIPETMKYLNMSIIKVGKFLKNEPKKKPWLLWEGCKRTMDNLIENYNKSIKFLEACEYNYTHMDKSHCEESETNFENIDLKRQILELSYNSSVKLKKPTPTPRPSPTPKGWTPPSPTPEPDPNVKESVFFVHVREPDVPEYQRAQFLEPEPTKKGEKFDLRQHLERIQKKVQQRERTAVEDYFRLKEQREEQL